jgi:hypothetical protein
MTDATAESLIAALQRLADGQVELKRKVAAAEEVLRRNNELMYRDYMREINELQRTPPRSISEGLVAELRTKLVNG